MPVCVCVCVWAKGTINQPNVCYQQIVKVKWFLNSWTPLRWTNKRDDYQNDATFTSAIFTLLLCQKETCFLLKLVSLQTRLLWLTRPLTDGDKELGVNVGVADAAGYRSATREEPRSSCTVLQQQLWPRWYQVGKGAGGRTWGMLGRKPQRHRRPCVIACRVWGCDQSVFMSRLSLGASVNIQSAT